MIDQEDFDPEYDDFEQEEVVSKSQLKRDAAALQDLGEELVNLRDAQLKKIVLPDNLRDAVNTARRINSRGALRRQLQYIGRLMRDVDAEPIRRALDLLKGTSREAAAHFHRLERWREALLREGDEALGELLEEYPQADSQHLRQLVRNARREQEQGSPKGAGRALFRYLRELAEGNSDEAGPEEESE